MTTPKPTTLRQVACSRPDNMLNIHLESEYCEMCQPTTAPEVYTHCTNCEIRCWSFEGSKCACGGIRCEAVKAPDSLDAIIADVVRAVAELPDRTSPDDWPEAMLVTGDELRAILAERLAALQAQQGQERLLREAAERQVERMALCPDHRDKATGRCIVCQAEDRTNAEWHHRKEKP